MNDTNVKEWILPCNLNLYNLPEALSDLKIIDWHQPPQMKTAQVGDLVYIYCRGKEIGSICYKGAILAVNKTENIIDDSKYYYSDKVTEGPCIEIAVFREYTLNTELTYKDLKDAGLTHTIRGPISIKGSVSDYLHLCDEKQRQADRLCGEIPDTCLAEFPIDIYEIVSDDVETTDKTLLKTYTENGNNRRINYWIFALEEDENIQNAFIDLGIIAIDWWSANLGDLSCIKSQEEIVEKMQNAYGVDKRFRYDSQCIYQFCNEMKVGDIVFCKEGLFALTGVCKITSQYYYSDTEELGRYSKKHDCMIDTYKHRRNVEWIEISKRHTDKRLPRKPLIKLTDRGIIKSLINWYRIMPLSDNHSDEEREAHAKSLSLDDLERIAIDQKQNEPKSFTSYVTQIKRDPYIAEFAKRRANGICQLCGLPAPFNNPDGVQYLESHHIKWLSDGGEDSVENTVAVCPNCHK